MLSRIIRNQLTTILLAFIAAGFALLLVELILINHVFQLQIIAVGSSVVGLVLSLLAFVPHRTLRRIITGLFVVLALVGAYGFVIHQSARTRHEQQAASVAPSDDRVIRRALTNFARNPPLVPPLALSGLAALGVVTLLSATAQEATAKTTRQQFVAAD